MDPFRSEKLFSGTNLSAATRSTNRATIELPPGDWILHQSARLDPIVLRSKSGAFRSILCHQNGGFQGSKKKNTVILLKWIEKQQMFVDTRNAFGLQQLELQLFGMSSVDFALFKW